MKKHYILFFLFSWISFYGQTYNFKITSGILCNTCRDEGAPPGPTFNTYEATKFSWSVKNNTVTIASENKSGYIPNGKITTSYTGKFQAGSLFTVSTNSIGTWQSENGTRYTCNTNESSSQSIERLIVDGNFGYYDSNCGVNANIGSFSPNMTIQHVTPSNPNEICAGATLTLNAFSTNDSATFPSVAYHWQYSLGNDIWIDFPATITNNTPAPIFSIQQLLGASHEFYFDKIIYFRTGYNRRPFSNILAIKYSSCAPVINAITYVGPQCYGDKIQKVDITFNRPLSSNEGLQSLAMVNVQSGAIRNQRNNIEITDFISPNIYSYINLENDLEPGKTYKFVYQAKINNPADPTKPFVRGTMDSPVATNFTYNPPTPLIFNITNKQNPSCVGGNDGFIEIAVTSGTQPYNFYIDEQSVPATYNSATGKYYINGLKDKTYNVKVTDKFTCIDKTANDI